MIYDKPKVTIDLAEYSYLKEAADKTARERLLEETIIALLLSVPGIKYNSPVSLPALEQKQLKLMLTLSRGDNPRDLKFEQVKIQLTKADGRN